MAGRFGPNVLISLVLLLLDLGAFVVMLGAASAIQKHSPAITSLLNSQSADNTLTYGDLTPTTTPARLISYEWFKAVLQVVILLFALGALATGQFRRFRISICCLLAVTAVLFCDASQTFYYLHIQTDAAEAVVGSNIAKMVRAYWAGCLMTAALNLALIITIGSGLNDDHNHSQKNYNDSARAAAPGTKGYGANPNELAGGNGATVV